MSDHFYGVARRAAPATPSVGTRPPDPRGVASRGRIAKLLVGQGHGFIRLPGGREIYFHRSDLREGISINDLAVDDPVTFELLEDAVSGARARQVAPRRSGR